MKEESSESKLMEIDLGAVIASRLGRKSWLVPGFVVRSLQKLICQDRLNEMLRVAYPRRGGDFCRAVIEHLGVKVDVRHEERLPSTADRRVIFVSNHPLGGLDGMILIDMLSRRYGVEPRFVVNDLLMAVEPLTDVFLPVNKHGSQSRKALKDIDEAMKSDVPVIIFPAGLCSRSIDGTVKDLQWQKMAAQKALEFNRTIVPVYFDGENSSKFYRLARWRQKIGIKFNIEMTLLPSEIFKAEGKTFTITAGEPIAPTALGSDPRVATRRLRKVVDSLKIS